MRRQHLAPLLLLSCLPTLAARTPSPVEPLISTALHQLYDSNFDGSRVTLGSYSSQHPGDPLGYAFLAATYLFADLDRAGAMKKNFLTDDRNVSSGQPLAVDPLSDVRFNSAVKSARERATADLAKSPDDQNALLAMCIISGVQRDRLALVEHRLRESYEYIKESQSYALRLLAINPRSYDAYLTKGFTEYLAASLPFYLRWPMKMDGISGTKEQGLQDLQIAAESGHYMAPFAKLLLAMFYLREKQGHETERLLAQLATEYPNNVTFRNQLEELSGRRRSRLD